MYHKEAAAKRRMVSVLSCKASHFPNGRSAAGLHLTTIALEKFGGFFKDKLLEKWMIVGLPYQNLM